MNGRLVPLRTPLVNGDIVEILTSPAPQPSRDWLAFVVTSRARNKIRAFLQTKEKQKSIEIGRRFLEKELKKVKRSFGKLVDAKAFDAVLPELGVARVDDLLAEIGYGKIPPRVVVQKLFPQEEPAAEKAGSSRADALKKVVRKILPIGGTGILVRGENDLLATLAKCCRPVPGEEIVGYVTRGRGVSVHSAACPNVRNLLFDPSREIEVEWHVGKDASFTVDFEVQVEDRPGILARITQVISDAGVEHRVDRGPDEPGRDGRHRGERHDAGSPAPRQAPPRDPGRPGGHQRETEVQRLPARRPLSGGRRDAGRHGPGRGPGRQRTTLVTLSDRRHRVQTVHPLRAARDRRADLPQVRAELAVRDVVGVADPVSGDRGLSADLTHLGHGEAPSDS